MSNPHGLVIVTDRSGQAPIYDMFEIDYYYRSAEPMIRVCNDYTFSLVFRGGYSISMNKGIQEDVKKVKGKSRAIMSEFKLASKQNVTETTNVQLKDSSKKGKKFMQITDDFKEEIKGVLIEAEHWRKMFGFCPIKIYHDSELGRDAVSIPSLGEGSFLKKFNPLTDKYYFDYVPNNSSDNSSTIPGYRYYCYTWPDKQVGRNIDFISEIRGLWEEWDLRDEIRENFRQADFESSHIPLVVKNGQKTPDVDQMTTEHIMSDNPVRSQQYEMMEYDMARRHRCEKFEAATEIGKMQRREMNSCYRYSSRSGFRMKVNRLNGIESGNLFSLPTGEEITNTPVPRARTVSEMTAHTDHYIKMVCLTMGVPLSYMISDSKTFKTEETKEQDALYQRVEKVRQSMKSFFSFLSKKMFRQEMGNITDYLNSKLHAEKLVKLQFLKLQEQRIKQQGEWKDVFDKLEIDGYSSDEKVILDIAEKEYVSEKNTENELRGTVDIQRDLKDDPDYIKILNNAFSEFAAKRLDQQYDEKFKEVSNSMKDKPIMTLEFLGLPFLQFKPLAEVSFAMQNGVMTDQEIAMTLRNRVGLETSEDVLLDREKEVAKRREEAKEAEKAKMMGVGQKKPGEGSSPDKKEKQPKDNKDNKGKEPEEPKEPKESKETKESKESSSEKKRKSDEKKSSEKDNNSKRKK